MLIVRKTAATKNAANPEESKSTHTVSGFMSTMIQDSQ